MSKKNNATNSFIVKKDDNPLSFHFSNIHETVQDNVRVINFSVTGKPPVQQRPRVNFWRNGRSKTAGKNTMRPFFYDPSRDVKQQWSAGLREALKANSISTPLFGSNPYIDQPITLEVQFNLSRPLGETKKKKKNALNELNTCHLWPATKDLDNMLKFVMDAMQGIAYLNDNSVCSILCIKKFISVNPDDIADNGDSSPYTMVTLKQSII